MENTHRKRQTRNKKIGGDGDAPKKSLDQTIHENTDQTKVLRQILEKISARDLIDNEIAKDFFSLGKNYTEDHEEKEDFIRNHTLYARDVAYHPEPVTRYVYRSIPCRIIRNDIGYYCGYLMLPKDHAALTEERYRLQAKPHVEFTYQKNNELGFDCGHMDQDFVPNYSTLPYVLPGKKTYWTFEMVKAEVERLVDFFCDLRADECPSETIELLSEIKK
jgi:hypothetical protein